MEHDKKPNVFLAGAPKCGTTSLANWLSEHPQCYVCPKKEPHFFGDFVRKRMTLEEYEGLFDSASPAHKVRVDASTSYFTIPRATREVLNYSPDARFIVMLRNPTELVYSLYSEVVYAGAETAPSFEKAWALQETRKAGGAIPLSCNNPEMLFYRDQALLGVALERLQKNLPASRLHWIFVEDLKADPHAVYQGVLEFLSLEDDLRKEFPVKNRSKRHRFPRVNRVLRAAGRTRARLGLPGVGLRSFLNSRSKVEAPRGPLSLEMKRELYQSFRQDIGLLERLTERDLSHWDPDQAGN